MQGVLVPAILESVVDHLGCLGCQLDHVQGVQQVRRLVDDHEDEPDVVAHVDSHTLVRHPLSLIMVDADLEARDEHFELLQTLRHIINESIFLIWCIFIGPIDDIDPPIVVLVVLALSLRRDVSLALCYVHRQGEQRNYKIFLHFCY